MASSNSKKRLNSNPSSNGSTKGSKLRKVSGHTDDSDESSSSINVYDHILPKWTSQWTKNDLDRLRFFVDRSCSSVKKMFDEWLTPVIAHTDISLSKIETRAWNIITHLGRSDALTNLNFDTIFDMNIDTAHRFFTTHRGCTNWTYPFLETLHDEQHWFHMFTYFVDKFAEDLRYMLEADKEGDTVTEAMYNVLFQDFLGLFGLNSYADPLVRTAQVKIGSTDICSIPDIIITDQPSDTNSSRKILAVIKTLHGTNTESVVSDKLIGQHGGDLLLHCPKSSCVNGVLGMIVQNTHVAFTYLSCNNDQFMEVQKGKCSGHHPSLSISKFYNYLNANDREELLESLVKLGLLQTVETITVKSEPAD